MLLKQLVILLALTQSLFAKDPDHFYLSLGQDALEAVEEAKLNSVEVIFSNKVNNIAIIKIKSEHIPFISSLIHEKLNRCGGFFVESSIEDARMQLFSSPENTSVFQEEFYTITEEQLTKKLIQEVDESEIRKTIETLSSFRNRYYKSQHGVASQKWVMKKWQKYAEGRNDVSVKLFNHSAYPQPSVILTIEGHEQSDEFVVVGGHGDSIVGWYPDLNVRAPGADDNASGIATMTEVIRILMKSNFKPKRTLQFMSYAAEEVGLRGSKEIAKAYSTSSKKVAGALQLDMTNFKGSEHDIVLISDYTDKNQNTFLKKLITHYLPEISFSEDKCGYACSDHASWNRYGFPASFPFESTNHSHNRHIHTIRDTIDKSGSHANHAINFAKITIAFGVEMAKNSQPSS